MTASAGWQPDDLSGAVWVEVGVSDPRELLRAEMANVALGPAFLSALHELAYTAREGGLAEDVESQAKVVMLAMRYAEAGVPDEMRM